MNKALVEQVNIYLANIAVSYIKLHNLHWNVVGGQFKAVHEYLETLYDALADTLDDVAELLKMNGAVPMASLKDYLAAATIQELESVEMNIQDVMQTVLADMETLKAQASAIRTQADTDDQFDVANKMEDDLTNYSKTIWFIRAMLK